MGNGEWEIRTEPKASLAVTPNEDFIDPVL
jgi:hypothetical protein